LRRTSPGALFAAPATDPPTSRTPCAALCAASCALSLASDAAPKTLSLTPPTADLTLSVWRWAIFEGLTFSSRLSTSWLSAARVASMSARIASGSFVVMMSPVL
jgi:hypothetical protein